jgi:hypothetical protein
MALVIQYWRAHMTVSLSAHARVRMQQRGISPEALATLLAWGATAPGAAGTEIVFFHRSERAHLGRTSRRARGRDRLCGLYAVIDQDGMVITVGHRYRRLARIGSRSTWH